MLAFDQLLYLHMHRLRWPNTLLWLAHSALIALVASITNTAVPAPYMDEIFHVRQAQTYCQGQWTQWDPKLTTPPGLYLPSAILSHYLSVPLCSINALRAVNAILVALLPFLLTDLLSTLRHGPKHTATAFNHAFKEALAISSFPLVYFFGFLYYTDISSLAVVLLSYSQALRRNYKTSALVGLASLLFRQTNILWVAFIAFEALDNELHAVHKAESRTNVHENITREKLCDRFDISNLSSVVMQMILDVVNSPGATLKVALPNIPCALAFLAFIRWNGGIVLGDKTMHVAVLHIPQLYYFVSFTCFMAAPLLFLDTSTLKESLRAVISSPIACFRSACASLLIVWTVKHHTIEHPFLLADNRHYPFYIWRKIINIHPYARYALAPVYWAGTNLLLRALKQARCWSLLSFLAFVAVTILTLVPSPLLEFRYFIIPYVILRLHLRPVRRSEILCEFGLYATINLVTSWVFWTRPFKWPTEDEWQRFMW